MSLQKMHNTRSGRIFMVGNGPSLGQTDLSCLRNEDVFVCNGFFNWTTAPFRPQYYGINSNKRHLIEDIGALHPLAHKFLIKKNFPSYGLSTEWEWVEGNFGLSIAQHGFTGLDDELAVLRQGRSSVLTLTQIAAWLGYTEFFLLGCEQTRYGHVYAGSGPLAERRKDGGLGDLLTDKEWQENDQATFDSHAVARTALEGHGRAIYDCTPGGRLGQEGIIEHRPLQEVLA